MKHSSILLLLFFNLFLLGNAVQRKRALLEGNIKITSIKINDENKDKFNKKNGKYITIEFNDITDYNNSKEVEKIFIEELKNMLVEHKISDDERAGNQK